MRDSTPIVTISIFLACVAVFVLSFRSVSDMIESIFVTPESLKDVVVNYGFYPNMILKRPYIMVTHMFIHGDWVHLLTNMLLFVYVGIFLEEKIGSTNFLLLFLFSGFFAILFNILLRAIVDVPNVASIGASGAIFGILALGALLIPDKKIPIIFIPILNIISPFVYFLGFKMDGNVILTLIFFTVFSFLMIFIGQGGLTEISHIGGMIGGFLYFWFMGKDRKKEKNMEKADGFEDYGFSLNK